MTEQNLFGIRGLFLKAAKSGDEVLVHEVPRVNRHTEIGSFRVNAILKAEKAGQLEPWRARESRRWVETATALLTPAEPF